MTNDEAKRILNEHRSEKPIFIRRERRYTIRPDGRVEIELAVGKSGLRWKSYTTLDPEDFFLLPADVRQKAMEMQP